MKAYPTVVASIDRKVAIELLEFEGSERIQNRDARGFYFMARLNPKDPETRIAVVFSGTVMAIKPDAFGLPDYGDRDTTFRVFAEAAIGDFLDEHGLPEFAARGTQPTYIDCFSPHFQLWKDRAQSRDDVVEHYLRTHVFQAWRFDQPSWRLGPPDLLRLNVTLQNAMKFARLHQGVDWSLADVSANGATLTPTQTFLRDYSAAQRVNPSQESATNAPPTDMLPSTYVFVDESRITELRSVDSRRFDLRKLLMLCEELNQCYRSQCYHSVAALTRSLIDHIPPIFGCRNFSEVANNYSGTRSFKDCAKRLEDASRKIADSHLHSQIRSSEILPTRVQVNFSNELDVILGEVIRILQANESNTRP